MTQRLPFVTVAALSGLTAASLALVHCGKEDDKTAIISYDLGASTDGNYAFATTKSGAADDLKLTLTNGGKGPASSMAMELAAVAKNSDDSEPFIFKGGTYPGTGGTCSDSLAKGDSCTVVVSFNPVTAAYASADYTGAIAISFNDGKTSQTKTFNLTGTGTLCAGGAETAIDHSSINTGSARSTSSTATRFAQSFVLGSEKDVKNVILSQYNGQNAVVSQVDVAIHADASGIPAATALQTLSGLPAIQAGSRSWITYTMPRPVTASAGSRYWIVVSYGMTSADLTYIDVASTDYADGAYKYSNDSGGTWMTPGASTDLAFKVETCK